MRRRGKKNQTRPDSPVSISSDDEPLDPLSPWQRRVVLQKIKELKTDAADRTQCHVLGPAIPNRKKPRSEHHWLPGSLILVRAPWDEGLQVPVTLTWLGEGRNRVTYDLQPDRVLKLLTGITHGLERHFSNNFPRLCAPVIWEGPPTLQWDNARERGTVVMNGLVMKKCHLMKPWLIHRQGTVKAFEFLAYTFMLVQYLFHKNVQLRDIGSTNLAVEDISQESLTSRIGLSVLPVILRAESSCDKAKDVVLTHLRSRS